MSAAIVRVTALTRHFDTRVAVDDVSFEVRKGEVVSLLGPNGAGKTTTFRMLAALIMPTSGQVSVGGVALSPSTASSVRANVGLLTESPGLWERLSVSWNLRTYAELHSIADAGRRIAACLARVGLSDRADDRAGALSKGLKQRLALARALVHDPEVVLLDEPTAGLDPASARSVRDLIRQLGAEGRAVLVSTHNLTEAEEVSNRIAILNTRLLACDTTERLREERGGHRATIDVEGPAEPWLDWVALPGMGATANGSILKVALDRPDRISDVVRALVEAGARVRRVELERRSLEEAYMALVREDG